MFGLFLFIFLFLFILFNPILWLSGPNFLGRRLIEYISGFRAVENGGAAPPPPTREKPNRNGYKHEGSVAPGIDWKWPFFVLILRTMHKDIDRLSSKRERKTGPKHPCPGAPEVQG